MNKLHIIGKLSDKFYAFEDKDAEIWGCNWHDDFNKLPRYDLWFDIHEPLSEQIIQNINCTKLMRYDANLYKTAYNTLGGEYINNSMCYMLFYAYLMGYKHVKFYGCALLNDTEIRYHQREALNMVIMFCRGKGMIIESNRPELFITYNRYPN